MKQMTHKQLKVFLLFSIALLLVQNASAKSYEFVKKDGKIVAIRSTINPHKSEIEETCERIKQEHINFLQLEFTDVFGNPKSVTITAEFAESVLNDGLAFDGSSVSGYTTVSRSDLLLIPDLETLKVLPWTDGYEKTARIICDVYEDDGTPFETCPRIILKRVMQEARILGYDFFVAPELEFFLIKKGYSSRKHLGYNALGTLDDTTTMKMVILDILKKMGIKPEKTHHEVATNQHEITMRYGSALTIADNLITMKNVIRYVAEQYDYDVLFMPKPFFGINGSGMHIHFSLFDINRNVNIFYAPHDTNLLSLHAKQFIAGILKYISEITAIFNPTINSYKRLVVGYEAPVYICWGSRNRSTLIRIPPFKEGNSKAARAEIRSPDPMTNPYLAFTLLLKVGLEGMKNHEKLAEEITDNLFVLNLDEIQAREIAALPSSLEEAIEQLETSTFAKDILGERLHAYFVASKKTEAEQFRLAVTDWEHKRYR